MVIFSMKIAEFDSSNEIQILSRCYFC